MRAQATNSFSVEYVHEQHISESVKHRIQTAAAAAAAICCTWTWCDNMSYRFLTLFIAFEFWWDIHTHINSSLTFQSDTSTRTRSFARLVRFDGISNHNNCRIHLHHHRRHSSRTQFTYVYTQSGDYRYVESRTLARARTPKQQQRARAYVNKTYIKWAERWKISFALKVIWAIFGWLRRVKW